MFARSCKRGITYAHRRGETRRKTIIRRRMTEAVAFGSAREQMSIVRSLGSNVRPAGEPAVVTSAEPPSA